MPVQTTPAAVGGGALGDLRAELLNPPEDGRPIHGDPTLPQQVTDILVREREPAVLANSQQNDVPRKPVTFERIAAHGILPVPRQLAPTSRQATQQRNSPVYNTADRGLAKHRRTQRRRHCSRHDVLVRRKVNGGGPYIHRQIWRL